MESVELHMCRITGSELYLDTQTLDTKARSWQADFHISMGKSARFSTENRSPRINFFLDQKEVDPPSVKNPPSTYV